MVEHAVAPAVEIPEHHRTTTGQSHRKVMMWTFLGSECMFFGSLIATFFVYHNNTGGGPIRQDVLSSLGLVSLMAFVLLISSFTMVMGLAAARRGDQTGMTFWLLATVFLGLFFIGSQGFEFYSFVNHHHAIYDAQGNIIGESGLNPTVNLFGASFMALTGFHGAHVSGGIIWLASVVMMVRVNPSQPRLPAKAIGLVSGFVFIFVFGLMTILLWREIDPWWYGTGAAAAAGLVAANLVALGFVLKYARGALRGAAHEPRRPITATMLPPFLSFLSGVPRRSAEQRVEVRPRHQRYAAFARAATQPSPPPLPPEEASISALQEYEEHRLTEERVLNVELVGLYWHFVDVVWVVIFTVVYLLQGEHPFK